MQDKANAILINASRMDEEFGGIATGLSTAITKDGQTTVTADLPMAGFKHTGVGNASARNQYATVAQVQDGGAVHATSGGSVNALTLSVSPAITAYVAGQTFTFKAADTNTGAATLAVSGLAAKAIQRGTNALTGGEILAGDVITVTYDGTQFQITSFSRAGNGTVALPGLSFGQDTDTGLYIVGANNLGIATNGTKAIDITSAGEVTMPLSPAFLAVKTAETTDVTGNNATYLVVCDEEVFDRNADHSTSTGFFTAPVTGIYEFQGQVAMDGLVGATVMEIQLVASNRTFAFLPQRSASGAAGATDQIDLQFHVLVDMDAADTASMRVRVNGVGANTADVLGAAATGPVTWFSGRLVA